MECFMNVLAINCGSSAIKWRLSALDAVADASQSTHGRIERRGSQAVVRFEAVTGERLDTTGPVADHGEGIGRIADWIGTRRLPVDAVRHRGVHGGSRRRRDPACHGSGLECGVYKQAIRDKLIEHQQHIERSGDDVPEVRDWMWSDV